MKFIAYLLKYIRGIGLFNFLTPKITAFISYRTHMAELIMLGFRYERFYFVWISSSYVLVSFLLVTGLAKRNRQKFIFSQNYVKI